MLESLCPSYSLRCLIYPKIGEDRWCWKYIFTKCRRHFDPRNFLGSMVLKINFIERRWLVDKCMRGDFWRRYEKECDCIYEKNKWKMWSELKWIFHISIYFSKKIWIRIATFASINRENHSDWKSFYKFLFFPWNSVFFPPCLSYIFHSIIKLVVSVHIITCIRKKLINLYINHMKLSIKLIKLCNIKYDIFGPDKLINM